MFYIRILIFISCCFHSLSGAGIGVLFPEAWDGDKYQKAQCISQNIPKWLDGYFLVQTSASYGKQSDPFGQKLTHLFDGIGALCSFQFENGQVKFSAKYYPSRSYKIWDFYNRNMTQSKVAWIPPSQSPYNETQYKIWKSIPLQGNNNDPVLLQSHTNMDFWKIGNQVIGVDEQMTTVGTEFNVETLANFRHPPPVLSDNDDIFKGRSSIVPLMMTTNERRDKKDVLYAAGAAYDPTKSKMYQIIFKILPSGVRSVEGIFETGDYDPMKCSNKGAYTGDKLTLASYMRSITTTERYVVLPMTSALINPCKLQPLVDTVTLDDKLSLPEGIKQNYEYVEYSTDVPLRFLIFDKINKKFITERPVKIDVPMMPMHQFNAYETEDSNKIIMDMTAFEGRIDDLYALNKLMNEGVGKVFRLLRFTYDLRTNELEYNNLLTGQDYMDMEVPNYNRKFVESKYKYGYATTNFFKPGGRIAKLAMDARVITAEFLPPNGKADGTVLREPWFVQRPDATDEDDGVVLTLGGDIASGKSTLYVIDAKTMNLQGQAEINVLVPLGLHNRFFTKEELGLSSAPVGAMGADPGGPQPVLINSNNNVQISPFEEAFYRLRYEQQKNSK